MVAVAAMWSRDRIDETLARDLAERLVTSPARKEYEDAVALLEKRRVPLSPGRKHALLVLLEAALRRKVKPDQSIGRIHADHVEAIKPLLDQVLHGARFALEGVEPRSRAYEDIAYTVLPHLCDAIDELERRSTRWNVERRGSRTLHALRLTKQLRLQIRCTDGTARQIAAAVFGLEDPTSIKRLRRELRNQRG